MTGLGAYVLTGAPSWAVRAVTIGTVIPWTVLLMLPLNKQLLAAAPSAAADTEMGLLARWAKLLVVRSVLSTAALVIFLAAARRLGADLSEVDQIDDAAGRVLVGLSPGRCALTLPAMVERTGIDPLISRATCVGFPAASSPPVPAQSEVDTTSGGHTGRHRHRRSRP